MTIIHEAKCDQCGKTEPARELNYISLCYVYPNHWVTVSRDGKSTTVCSPKCAAKYFGYC